MELGQKLQLAKGQGIVGVGVPEALSGAVAWAPPSRGSPSSGGSGSALVAFVKARAELEAHRAKIVASASQDRLTWVAYPKGGQLGTDLNRDALAAALAESGVRPVRQIALDEVWSALRFRPA